MNTLVVTGGAGFIGSHLVAQLIKEKNLKIVVVDIVVDPRSFFAVSNLKKHVIFKKLDIADRTSVDALFKTYKPSYVFHLAAEALVTKAIVDPYRAFQTNVMGTVHILEAARNEKSTKGIIVASTDKAYGKTNIAYTEESPLRADHPYDVSKASADLITQAYFKTYNMPVVITRFGNVYGEGDFHFDRIIPGICKAIIEKKPLRIRSNGKYVRDYVYVKDVVEGYLTLFRNLRHIHGEAYNFSSGDSFSVLELIKKAEDVLKVNIPYVVENTARNEIPYQHLDDTKIKKLGWKNQYTFEQILPQILDWYKRYYS